MIMTNSNVKHKLNQNIIPKLKSVAEIKTSSSFNMN